LIEIEENREKARTNGATERKMMVKRRRRRKRRVWTRMKRERIEQAEDEDDEVLMDGGKLTETEVLFLSPMSVEHDSLSSRRWYKRKYFTTEIYDRRREH
jgi:hypothetical protein